MVDAAVTQYRDEYIAGFEDGQSRLRDTCVTETVIKGNTATFLVSDSGGATATTRGVNGLIPARTDNNTQSSATLVEWHDLAEKTGFNIFASQGDQRRLMQETTRMVMNRKIDSDIISQLDTATVTTGAAAVASVSMVAIAKAKLGYANVPTEEMDNIWGVVTPGFMAHLQQTTEFASSDYVDIKMFSGATRKTLRWFGVNWIEHPSLTGSGTSSESCYLYHKNSIGHAVDVAGMDVDMDYEKKQQMSWARCSIFMGSKLLQNTGIVKMVHDGSAF